MIVLLLQLIKNKLCLIEQLKSVYVFIYYDCNYLNNLDIHIRNTITNLLGKDKFSEYQGKYVYISENEKQARCHIPALKNIWYHKVSINGLEKTGSNVII